MQQSNAIIMSSFDKISAKILKSHGHIHTHKIAFSTIVKVNTYLHYLLINTSISSNDLDRVSTTKKMPNNALSIQMKPNTNIQLNTPIVRAIGGKI